MRLTNHPVWRTGYRSKLPPSLPLPSLLQAVAGRLRPFDSVEIPWNRYGNCFTIYPTGMPPTVLLSSPEDIKAILTAPADSLHSGGGGTLMVPLFGENAFVLHENDDHSSVRNAIMPAFHKHTLQSHVDTITDVVAGEVASWPVDTPFPLSPYLHRLTLKVMLMTAIASREPIHETLGRRMLAMLSVMASPLLQEPRLRHLPGWRKTWARFLRDRHEVDELIYMLITKRRNGHTVDGPHQHDRRDDLLNLLLAAHNPDGSPLSDRQVRDNLIAVIVAGHETTAATLAWAFQLLAHNQAVQGRLTEEIDDGSSDTYMKAVIDETLRHKPTFLFLPPRVVLKPTEIGGWDYRPPAQLAGCTYLLNHNPEIHPSPHTFRPERFLSRTPRPGTLLPWGGGRKRCPGRHLALTEIQLVLHHALSTRLVQPVSSSTARPQWRTVVLTPHAASRVILRRRRPSTAQAARPGA